MKALIYKDLIALKKTVLFLLAVLAVVSFGAFRQRAVLMLPMIFVLIPIILLGILFGSDTQSRSDLYIISGPIKRRSIVLSRYAFVWCIALIGILFTIALKLLANEEVLAEIPYHLIVTTMLLFTTLIAVIQLPLMYKFGAEQGRLIFLVLYFTIFALFTYIGGQKEFLSELMSNLKNINLSVISLILIGITLLLNGASFALSVTIYAKKEF